MDWGFVFKLKEEHLVDRKLTPLLLRNYWNPEEKSLFGKKIDNHAFQECYDMPSGGIRLQRPARANHKDKRGYARNSKYSKLVAMTRHDLWTEVLSGNLEEEEFCIYFMTGVLNLLVAPSYGNGVTDTSFLEDIENPEIRKKLNLSAFAAEFLVDSVEAWYNRRLPHVRGCVHIFELMFADVILTGHEQQPSPGRPRTCFITQQHIECARQVWFRNLSTAKVPGGRDDCEPTMTGAEETAAHEREEECTYDQASHRAPEEEDKEEEDKADQGIDNADDQGVLLGGKREGKKSRIGAIRQGMDEANVLNGKRARRPPMMLDFDDVNKLLKGTTRRKRR